MKKSLAAVALAGSIALVGAVPAMAVTPYPAPPAQGTVSDGTVAPGEAFTFSGSGFTPGEAITVTVTLTGAPQALGGSTGGGVSMAVSGKISLPMATQTFSTKADANGNFALPLTISEAGTYTLTATGQTSGKTVTATVKVSGAAVGTSLANTGSGAGLANTGADASLLLWTLVGGGALAAGITSVVVVRRRAKADVAV
ncbi:LPXTG cell wall anchor domain-containing protein [Pseudarthrobacter sp. B907]|uniref:LPXTG cell wall anchor domain-containing protein n=1 Tax=Pseudarthrobacter sp. B907 TaxID=3158261 RepID=UPI0032DAA318